MCQKRRGWPRSTVRKRALRMISGKATRCPMRIAGRSDGSPNRSSQAAAKYTPPVTPPTKKYRTIHQPQFGTWNDGLKSGGIRPSLAALHAAFAEGQHPGQTGEHRGNDTEAAASRQVSTWQVRRFGQTVRRRLIVEQIERVQSAEKCIVATVQPSRGVASLL